MRKIGISLLMLLAFRFGFGQNTHGGNHPVNENSQNADWNVYGNAIDGSDNLGSTNNYPINFITNNISRMVLGTDGNLLIKNLAGVGNRMLVADANGNLVALSTGVSAGATSWDSDGHNVYFNTGNLGIGTSSPAYKLDVVGSARISSNLYVGGGIVVTDKLDASIEVKAGDVKVNNDLEVTGNSRFAGNVIAPRGVLFDPNNSIGISYASPTGTNTVGSLIFGHSGPNLPPPPTCISVNNAPYQFMNGFIQSVSTGVNSALTMGCAPWDGSGIIEVEGTNADIYAGGVPTNGLMVNYFCGRNIYLGVGTGNSTNNNTAGTAGCKVYTGDMVSMRGTLKIGNSGNENFDLNTGIDLYNGTKATWNGIRFTTPWNGAKLISCSNSNFPNSPFLVYADGRTEINAQNTAQAFKISGYNGSTYANNFVVYGDGGTAIGGTYIPTGFKLAVNGDIIATEIWVKARTNWPDYVFNKDYKLINIDELDNFIKTNKHLPNIPSAKDFESNPNYSVNEMQIKMLEKIEELTLYIIELKKEIASKK